MCLSHWRYQVEGSTLKDDVRSDIVAACTLGLLVWPCICKLVASSWCLLVVQKMLQSQGHQASPTAQQSFPASSQNPLQPHVILHSIPSSHAVLCQPVQYQPMSPTYMRAVEEHAAVLRGLSGGSICEDPVTIPFARLQDAGTLQQQLSMGSSNFDGQHDL